MSEVLNRMVQRARGELQTVEPLVTHRRPPLGVQVVPGDEAHELDVVTRQSVRRTEDSGGNSALSPVKNLATQRSTQVASHNLGRNRADEMGQSAHHASQPKSKETGKDSMNAPALPSRANGERQVREMRTVEEAGAKPEMDPTAKSEIDVVPPPVRSDGPQSRRESALEVKSASSTSACSGPQHQSQNGASELDIVTEHTEIHITIGSIELRAPRAASKTPEFRPRVTLSDFLNRKPGADR